MNMRIGRPVVGGERHARKRHMHTVGRPTSAERLALALIHRTLDGSATVGRAALLTTSTVRWITNDIVRFRFPVGEWLQQAWFLLTVTAGPAALIAIPFGAMISVQAGGILHDVGATSLAGAAAGLGIVRQGAPMAAGLLMGGAAASAIASDLGTRSIRDEVDAMRVMGVDPVQRLVAPRLAAMITIAPIILATITLVGVGASLLISIQLSNVSVGSFWASFGGFATVTDLIFALLKTLVGAALVAVIASLRGLEARGGPKGVADAVNAAVVLSIVTIVFEGLVFTQVQTLFFPEQFA